MSAPLRFRWNGEAMEVLKHYQRIADKQFVIGEVYELAESYPRSANSHKAFFAAINEAWQNMPEDIAERWSTPDELRKWCLTFTEFRDVREYRASSYAEALRVAKYLREGQDYSRIEIDEAGKVVRQYIPRSQAYSNLNGREFQRSKEQVLDILAKKIGVTVEELEKNAGKAA
jgi:hypothetical protein